jgi:hypothetical protein
MSRDGFSLVKMRTIEDLGDHADDGIGYIFCLYRGECLFSPADRELKRQYLRAVAGEILGILDPAWDWSAVIRKDVFRATVKLAGALRLGEPPEL